MADDTAAAGGFAGRVYTLRQALHGLQNTTTGPGTAELNNAKSYIQALAPSVAKALGINPDSIAAYDEANKYLIQNASAAAGKFGPSTD